MKKKGGKFSRDKGKHGEREVCKLISKELGIECKRKLGAEREGGDDITDVPFLSIEVKRRESLSVGAWWKQAVEQAARHNPPRIPILFYRKSSEEWTVIVPPVFLNDNLHKDVCDQSRIPLTFLNFCRIYRAGEPRFYCVYRKKKKKK